MKMTTKDLDTDTQCTPVITWLTLHGFTDIADQNAFAENRKNWR